MNLLNFNHSVPSLFILSFRVYKQNFISILFLTAILMVPAFLFSIAGWGQTESIVFFISSHVLEAAICLGIIGIAFGSFFPSLGILRNFRSSFFLGSVHVAILQYLLFITGVIGLTLPFPLNILIISFWLLGLLMTYVAQPVFAVEGIRGMSCMIRSFRLVRNNLAYVFFVVLLTTILQFLIFALIFSIFMPELKINIENNENQEIQMLLSNILSDPEINNTIRWTQYLVSLTFYPFASLICAFLYFDISQREKIINFENLETMSNKLFGTPIVTKRKAEKTIDEDLSDSKKVEEIDTKNTTEDN